MEDEKIREKENSDMIEKGFGDEELFNMNNYLIYLIPAMLRELADRSGSFKKECGSSDRWKEELRHGADLWDNVSTDVLPDDDAIPSEYWDEVREERLHRAMAWLEENFFDLWD